MADNLDVDYLISLVESRPVLWDKSKEEYKDKNFKTEGWKDVCRNIFPSFDDKDNKEKTKLGYGIHLDDLNYKKRKYNDMEAYSQSKIANIMFSRELAAKLKEHNIEGVNTYVLHPGIIKTELGRNWELFWGLKSTLYFLMTHFMKSLEDGAQTTIYCAVDEKCANETGLYYSDCAPERPASKATNDADAKKLWEVSVEMVGLGDFNPFTANDPGVKTK